LAWQEPARFEGIRVDDYLSLGDGKVDPERALRHVGLDAAQYVSRFVDTSLSGGERKRIELAAVVAMKPRLDLTCFSGHFIVTPPITTRRRTG
jgi:Fe-S cluster assembly ATP-binding protein